MWSTSARTKHVLGSFRAGGAVTGASSVEETRGGSSTAASLPQGDAHRALIRPRTSTAAAAAHAESVRTLSAVWKDLDSSFLSLLSSYWSGQQHLLLPASSHQEKRFYLGPPPLLTSSFSFLPAYRKDTSWCLLFKKIFFFNTIHKRAGLCWLPPHRHGLRLLHGQWSAWECEHRTEKQPSV